MSRTRKWCYTYFPDNNEMNDTPPVKVLDVYQHFGQWEKCPSTGKIHFQGMLTFPNAKTFSAIHKLFYGRAHIEPMKGKTIQAYKYVTKDDTSLGAGYRYAEGPVPTESESLPSEAELIKQAILDGWSLAEIAAEFPKRFLHSASSIKLMYQLLRPVAKMQLPESLKPWQKEAVEYLKEEADDRSIVWVYDPQGGAGKSTLMKYGLQNLGAIQLKGKVADMAYLYNGEPIVFFDLSRSSTEDSKYLADFAEQLKNETIVSTKYEPVTKRFKSPHVVFLSNHPPWENMWTADRLKLVQLSTQTFLSAAITEPHWTFD